MESRFKQIRQHRSLNLSQEAFGKRLGVTGAAISRIENGSREPSDQIILAVCREFDVNETWLRTGDGEMFNQSSQTVLDELAKEFRLSNLERRIIDNYLKLSDSDRAAVQEWLLSVINVDSSDSSFAPAIPPVGAAYPERSQLDKLANEPADVESKLPVPEGSTPEIEAELARMREEMILEKNTKTSQGLPPANAG